VGALALVLLLAGAGYVVLAGYRETADTIDEHQTGLTGKSRSGQILDVLSGRRRGQKER
jgi:hypothetical protein